MKVAHADLAKVAWMVLVEIGSVMMLTTGHTATTGMLAMLAYSSMTGGDVPAAERRRNMSAFERMAVEGKRVERRRVVGGDRLC